MSRLARSSTRHSTDGAGAPIAPVFGVSHEISLSRIDHFDFDDAALASSHGVCGMRVIRLCQRGRVIQVTDEATAALHGVGLGSMQGRLIYRCGLG